MMAVPASFNSMRFVQVRGVALSIETEFPAASKENLLTPTAKLAIRTFQDCGKNGT